MNTTPQRFTKRPVTIEAAQLTGDTAHDHDIYLWIEANTLGSFEPLAVIEGRKPYPASGVSIDPRDGRLIISTLEGLHWADEGDWIIRGVQGEFYPCKPDIFEATYQPAQGGFIAPHVSEETREAIQEQLRDCILPKSWADAVTAEHDARRGTLRDALDATTYEDQPGHVTIYPYRTGEHVEGEQDAPTDAEVQAAAQALSEYDAPPTEGWEDLSETGQQYYLKSARAALVAARKVAGR